MVVLGSSATIQGWRVKVIYKDNLFLDFYFYFFSWEAFSISQLLGYVGLLSFLGPQKKLQLKILNAFVRFVHCHTP
jgi:hypothetical protein